MRNKCLKGVDKEKHKKIKISDKFVPINILYFEVVKKQCKSKTYTKINLLFDIIDNMSNNKSDHLIKHDRHSRRFKRRLKSSIVRDPNGSISTFRQFYQSGGRDYEQYRLWLQTLSKSEQLSTPLVDLNKIKKE